MAPETEFLKASVGKNEVFSSKNPVSLVECVSPVYVIVLCAKQSQGLAIASPRNHTKSS